MKHSHLIRRNKYTPLPVVRTMGGTGPTGPTGPVTIIAGPTGDQGITGPIGMTGNSIPPLFTSIQYFQSTPIQGMYSVPFTMTNFVEGKYVVIFNCQLIGSDTQSTPLSISYNGFVDGSCSNKEIFHKEVSKVLTEHTMYICNYSGTPPSITISTITAINLSELYVVFVYLNS